MVRKYFEEPKPVVWGEMFNRQKDEQDDDALFRCFPLLLEDRLRRYREFAHLSIPLVELYDTSGEETLAIIRKYLGT